MLSARTVSHGVPVTGQGRPASAEVRRTPCPLPSGNTALPYNADTLLITTLKDGLFLLKGNQLIDKRTSNDKVFANDRINCALRINENLYQSENEEQLELSFRL